MIFYITQNPYSLEPEINGDKFALITYRLLNADKLIEYDMELRA